MIACTKAQFETQTIAKAFIGRSNWYCR